MVTQIDTSKIKTGRAYNKWMRNRWPHHIHTHVGFITSWLLLHMSTGWGKKEEVYDTRYENKIKYNRTKCRTGLLKCICLLAYIIKFE